MRAIAILIVGLAMLAAPALARKSYPPVMPNISCPGDRVVWVSLESGVYHYQGERWFGRTKDGQF